MSSSDIEPLPAPARSPQWTWLVCLVLLSATFLNYANRFTFTQNALPIQEAFDMDEEGYGEVAGISVSSSGQATVDPSLANVLFDLALLTAFQI